MAAGGSCVAEVAEGLLERADLLALQDALRGVDLDLTVQSTPRTFQRFEPITMATFILSGVTLPVLTGIAANAAWQKAMGVLAKRHGQTSRQTPILVEIERRYANGGKVSEEIRIDASGAPPTMQDALVHLAMEDHAGCARCKAAHRRRRHRRH